MNDKKRKTTPQNSGQKHPGRNGNAISLYPMSPDEAMSRIARVKLADVKKLEAAEKKAKGKK